jgi:hypothetical protein
MAVCLRRAELNTRAAMGLGEMLRDDRPRLLSNEARLAALVSLALLTAGCSGTSLFGGGSTSTAPPPAATSTDSPSFRDKVSNFFAGSSARSQQPVAGAQADVDCPLIDIRQGASTLSIGADGTAAAGNNTAMSLKYQGVFVRAARECALVSGQMVMKIGVEGRIIVGPAGGPGDVNVPLRIAVIHETVSGSQPIVTKLIRIPVTVVSATDNPIFTHIEEGLSFPMPSKSEIDDYIVYIGFDPLAAEAQDKPPPKPKPVKHKTKPVASTGAVPLRAAQ